MKVSEYSFRCAVCGKKFEVAGCWWNEWILIRFLHLKFIIHCIVHHRK